MTAWNELRTDAYEGMLAETVTMRGYRGNRIHAYVSRPLGAGPYPGIILIPHIPGWDELNREVARRFTQHGFTVCCPNIYERYGHGLPADIAAKARAAGGVADESVMGDCEGALDYLTGLPTSNGKVGVIGMCSGGRHAFLAACRVRGLAAAVDCWGGRVVMSKDELSLAAPVPPIDYTKDLGCPLLGIFGNDDLSPTPEQVDLHEAALQQHGKEYEFHRYDGAGHAMWNVAGESYRPVQAMDSWNRALAFFDEHLRG